MQKKEYAKAIEFFKELQNTVNILTSEDPNILLFNCYALSGDTEKAKVELKAYLKEKQNYNPYWLSILYVTLHDYDNAMIQLQKGYDNRIIHMMHLYTNPHFVPVRKDPRFISLLKKMHFQD